MSFTVDVVSDVSNIISIDTSVSDTIETVIQDPVTDTKTLEINNNNYNTDFTYKKNIVDIETTNTQETTNYLDIEIYQTFELAIKTASTSEFIGNIHHSRVDGLEDFIEHGREFDCGTP
jgi:hypothetical protein